MKCKDCKHFKRLKFHRALGGGEQLGGNCRVLLEVLKTDNVDLVFFENIYIQDSFGCELGIIK